MLLTVGIIFFIYILTKVYVSVMEIGYVTKERVNKAVILTPSNYIKAADYKIANQRLDIIGSLVEYLIFIFWIGFGLKWLENTIHIDDLAIKSVVYVLLFGAIGFIFSLPFDLYKTFVLDKKFGFSNLNAKLYITDTIKSSVMFIIFGGIITWLISMIIINFDSWWLWGFGLIFAVIIAINVIYPTLIAPIFNKFTILENEELKESIQKLLSSVGLKTEGVFTIDASKRDNRLNAYFGGLGKSKRVVLFDTLIEKLTKSELLAVLGHELGHFKHKDILKNIAIVGTLLFIMFFIFGNLPTSLFEAISIQETPYSIIAMFLIFSPILSLFFMPLFGVISRHNEYHADEFGAECQSKEELASALQKLANENKSFPKSHPLFIFFYHSHPPLVERLKRLGVKVDG